MNEHYKAYMDGWIKGDLPAIVAACADDFVYDDPIDGRIDKVHFAAYLETLFEVPASERGLEVTHVIGRKTGEDEMVWCWWVSADAMEGAALARVGPNGLQWQKLTYYMREPNMVPGRKSI